jgi:hypothetical protein
MARSPGKPATLLFLLIGFGGLLGWIGAPMIWPDKTPVLSDFLGALRERSRELDPGGKRSVPLPALRGGEQVILAMGPYITTLGKDVAVSQSARSTINDDTGAEGAALTFVYLISRGEVRGRERVSRCNLTIAGNDALVIAPLPMRAAFIECGPVMIPSRPGECRDFVGLWNER